MNNLLDFNDYITAEIEKNILADELNEKKGGIRKSINRRKAKQIKSELSEEIEMSKTIIDGIKENLDSLSTNFNSIQKTLDKVDDKHHKKGDKEEVLDGISKIIEQARNKSWDINELIDEGEIDYAGFTGNVALSAARYIGILFTPYSSTILIHKGYNYFFALVKNTIRKALVMLQLNFDQFENLIIQKKFQSEGYMEKQSKSESAAELFGKINTMMFDSEKGAMKGKKGYDNAKKVMDAIQKQITTQMRLDKDAEGAKDAYACLDMYNNTYTKSLETLRQYSQDDVQKHLEAIKTSMSKIAGKNEDMIAFSELIIAAAEEHACKASTAIYNRFAKMTEVFSLPNQAKLLTLIKESDEEKTAAAQKELEEKTKAAENSSAKEAAEKLEESGSEIFKTLSGAELGNLEDGKYDGVHASVWTYEEFKVLKPEDRNTFEKWICHHPEVLKECDDTLKMAIITDDNDGYLEYVDDLIDHIGPCLIGEVSESHIINCTDYIMESSGKSTNRRCILTFRNIDKDMMDTTKKLYSKKNHKKAVAALESIGERILDDNGFVSNVDSIIKTISEALKEYGTLDSSEDKREFYEIKSGVFNILKPAISELKKQRKDDYPALRDEQEVNNTKKSEE